MSMKWLGGLNHDISADISTLQVRLEDQRSQIANIRVWWHPYDLQPLSQVLNYIMYV